MEEVNGSISLMGTTIRIWFLSDKGSQLLNEIYAKLKDYENRFSANSNDSMLMQINHQAGVAPVKVDEDLFELIQLGYEHSVAHNSGLNIAIGPLVQTWRIGFTEAHLPEQPLIDQALEIINPEDIILNRQDQSVYLRKVGMKIDLGALAKGFFADRILEWMMKQGVEAGMIDLGGNIVTFGEYPKHSDGFWRIGIQNPFQPRGNYVAALKIKNQSIVTSGIYERTMVVNGKKYHHIFNQKTGYPIETDLASLTVVSDQSVDGEIWTTRLFDKEPEQIISLLNEAGHAGVVLTKSGRMFYSSSLEDAFIR